jgi:hypothetical protein
VPLRRRSNDPSVEFLCKHIDLASELNVGRQLQFLNLEVMVGLGLLKSSLTVWPMITKVDKKIASSDTTRVKVGHELRSRSSIQTAIAPRGSKRSSSIRQTM